MQGRPRASGCSVSSPSAATASQSAIRGTYAIPSLIDVQVPVAAWFPFTGDDGAYVRIGSDGYAGRAGDPVTVTVLPGTLDLRAWAYLMIEEKALPNLGGKGDEWDFTGFSIGFGAGYDFEWGGRAVYLRAGSSIVVGLGTKPLLIKGELETAGELRFGPVGVSIEGNVELTLTKDDARLEGEFCGEVDLALFKAKGCVHITLGGAASPEVEADPLVAGVSLSDRHARVIATARDLASGGSTGAPHTAWVDCRPTVHFSNRVVIDLEGDSFRPTPAGGWGADWGGSARTKFLYRLRAVELLDAAGAVVEGSSDWPSNWWLPAGRPALPAEGDAPSSEHEAWDLALLAWDLAPWARALTDGGAATEGDPATVVERLCDPVPGTTRHCVYGADGERLEPDQVRLLLRRPEGCPGGRALRSSARRRSASRSMPRSPGPACSASATSREPQPRCRRHGRRRTPALRGNVVKAFIVLADGYEPSDALADEIKGHVRERLSAYAYPRRVEFVPELPKTLTGKIRRIELRQLELDRVAGTGS